MDLPVWVNGEQLWVNGVEKKTTCDDIIKVLLGEEHQDYSLFEKWKGVERRLRGVSKVWKIWKEWGDAQGEVRLTVKKEGRETPRKRKHPKTLKKKKVHQHPQNVELLLKLILIQGETIHKQLMKLKEKEEEIREIEEAKHWERVNTHGYNYLLKTYFDKEADSCGVTEYPTQPNPPQEEKVTDLDLEEKLQLWEKIAMLNMKIVREEETLVKLFIALREYSESEIINELRRLKLESEELGEEFERNGECLLRVEQALAERKGYLETLNMELEESERERICLFKILQTYASPQLDSHHVTQSALQAIV